MLPQREITAKGAKQGPTRKQGGVFAWEYLPSTQPENMTYFSPRTPLPYVQSVAKDIETEV